MAGGPGGGRAPARARLRSVPRPQVPRHPEHRRGRLPLGRAPRRLDAERARERRRGDAARRARGGGRRHQAAAADRRHHPHQPRRRRARAHRLRGHACASTSRASRGSRRSAAWTAWCARRRKRRGCAPRPAPPSRSSRPGIRLATRREGRPGAHRHAAGGHRASAPTTSSSGARSRARRIRSHVLDAIRESLGQPQGDRVLKVSIIGTGYVGPRHRRLPRGRRQRRPVLRRRRAQDRHARRRRDPDLRAGAARDRARQRGERPAALHHRPEARAPRHGRIQMIAVGTPPGEDGSADLSHVLAAARAHRRAHGRAEGHRRQVHGAGRHGRPGARGHRRGPAEARCGASPSRRLQPRVPQGGRGGRGLHAPRPHRHRRRRSRGRSRCCASSTARSSAATSACR